MKKIVLAALALLLVLSVNAKEFKEQVSAQGAQIDRINNTDFTVDLPRFIFSHTNTRVIIKFKDPNHVKLVNNSRRLHFIVNGTDQAVEFDAEGTGNFIYTFKGDEKLNVLIEDATISTNASVISIWYMVLPLAGVVLFLGYRLAFARRKLTVVHNGSADDNKRGESSLKVVKEEEEVLA